MRQFDLTRPGTGACFAGVLVALLVCASCQDDTPVRPQDGGALRVLLQFGPDSVEATRPPGKSLAPQIRRVDLQVHRIVDDAEHLLAQAGADIEPGQSTFRIETVVSAGENTAVEVAASGSVVDEVAVPEDGVLFYGQSITPFSVSEGGQTTISIILTPFYPRGLRASGSIVQGYRLDWTAVAAAESYVVRRFLPGGETDDIQVGASFALFPPDLSGALTGRVIHRVFAQNAYYRGALSDSIGVPLGATAPAPPTNLALLALSEDSVRVSWEYGSSRPNRFKIERRRFDQQGFAVADSVDGSESSFSDASLDSLTEYFYQVRASSEGVESQPAGPLSVMTLPPRPSGLSARDSTRSGVFLTWRYPSIEPTQFRVWRRDVTAGGAWVRIQSLDGSERTCFDGEVSRSSTYAYAIDAAIAEVWSKRSSPVTITVGLGIPPTPAGLLATAEGSDRIRLTWTDQSSNEERFEIERRQGQGEFGFIGAVGANIEEFIDSVELRSRTEYAFRIRAVSALGVSSDPSNIATDRTWPPVPFDLTTSVLGVTSIDLSWNYEEDPPDWFYVDRRICGQIDWEGATPTPGGTKRIVLTGLDQRTTYEFRIYAEDSGDLSAYALIAGATPPPPTTSLDAAFDPFVPQVNLAWSLGGSDPDHFDVERRALDDGDAWIALPGSPFDGSTRGAVDSGIQINLRYGYRVKVIDRIACGGDTVGSGWRTSQVSTDLLPPSPPGGLRATYDAQDPPGVVLEWDQSEGVVSSYEIQRRRTQDQDFTAIATRPGNVVSYFDPDILPARAYAYRVRALNLAGPSGFSNRADATTSGWRPIAVQGQSPSARNGHAGAWIPEQRGILIFGGKGSSPDTLSDMWLFRIADSTWIEQQYSSSPSIGGRYRASMAYDPGRRIAFMDGGSPWPDDGGGWFLDRGTSNWSWICQGDYGPEFSSKEGTGAAWLSGTQRFYAFGGWQYHSFPEPTYVQEYRTYWQDSEEHCVPITSPPEDLPGARAGHGMDSWGPSQFLLWGGRDETGPFNDFYLFTLAGGKTGVSGARLRGEVLAPDARYEADCASDFARSRFYVLGGFNDNGTPMNDLHVADISDLTATWTVLDPGGERNVTDPPATDGFLVVDPETGWLYHLGPGPSRLEVWLYIP